LKSIPFFAGIDGEGKDDPITPNFFGLDPKKEPSADDLRWVWSQLKIARKRKEEHAEVRGYHRYVLLAFSDADGNRAGYIENPKGLSTEECLEFLFEEIPDHARLFAYSMTYDMTMMLKDMSDRQLARLVRPETRRRPIALDGKPRPNFPVVFRTNGWNYKLDYMGSKFSIRRGNKRRVIWDVFKFFQSKFVAAIEDWKVGTEKQREQISAMKDKRGDFDKLDMHDVTDYCFDECRLLATLVGKLTDAHESAGLELKSYHGAGSTTTAMFNVMKIGEKIRPPPDVMREPVACSFYGGRFEHSVIGAVDGPVWSYDISSAYPYEMTFLPCLLHGTWERTHDRKRMLQGKHALVRYELGPWHKEDDPSWAPFPFRESSGAIVYPLTSGGGWVWRDEFLAGEKFARNVIFREAWVLFSECDCKPFYQLPGFYAERLKIGKEGPGIVIKLGMNGGYGKCAQSIGDAPPFQSWVWASMITSGTRGQILGAMMQHRDRSNLFAIATDGIYSREELILPKPRPTGTGKVTGPDGEEIRKPLGGWEAKVVPPPGVFFCRPGMYWPMDPKVKLKAVRARGVGRAVLYNNRERIERAFMRDEGSVELPDVIRFRGIKTAISGDHEAIRTKFRKGEVTRSPAYGQWERRPTQVSFDPRPKREDVYYRKSSYAVLTARRLPFSAESEVYGPAIKLPANLTEEVQALKMIAKELEEQPDLDFDQIEDEWKET
jgi:hypothetical protein